MKPFSDAELRALPCVVGVETAARALGISRTLAYQLAKEGDFPCQVIRIASTYRVATADLLRVLGVTREAPEDSEPVSRSAAG
ncbi:Helix-turn-helix domain-containing protein [Thermomonospora echinospora]|uniref:Helix-turn-helix domain-containing protein n=1 Tax=Thermomonospora echinospora TaxID=1992 RepID=A0A1H6AX38_9ACTN|nr:helix-turn-helix domain-containing protein [Thermomonospora echinospora]SEG52625.1 Helix-turn-helix domain-containing protein [Thermomonospora echinospora]